MADYNGSIRTKLSSKMLFSLSIGLVFALALVAIGISWIFAIKSSKSKVKYRQAKGMTYVNHKIETELEDFEHTIKNIDVSWV